MQAMVERDTQYKLDGDVQVDDAYLGSEQGRPLYIKLAPVPGFTRKAIVDYATENLHPESVVTSEGLACFAGMSDAGCLHRPIIAGGRKPKDLPEFNWINTVLGNLKTSLGRTCHSFDFAKNGIRYLGEFAHRFNRRFHLEILPIRLVVVATTSDAVNNVGHSVMTTINDYYPFLQTAEP